MSSGSARNGEPIADHHNGAARHVAETADKYAMVLKDFELLNGSNPILRSVTLAVPSGSVLGILGESGAGKTTLLRFIARKLDESVLTINGKGVLPREIWYIAQEDVLYEYDTPRRAVGFLHQLLYDEGAEKASDVAQELLHRVHFPEMLIDQHIGTMDGGGLSVGTRRLLNVALALCAKAKVILLDEPTTGLDSNTAANLVAVLKNVCATGEATAICTIHQPSDEALAFFDGVIVMNEGRAYNAEVGGVKMWAPTTETNASDMEESEQTFSRAEMLLVRMKQGRLPACTLPTSWSAEDDATYFAAESFHAQLGKLESMYQIPYLRQWRILMIRFWHRNWDNFFSLRFRFLIVNVLAVLIGVAFWKIPYDDPRAIRDFLGLYMAIIGCTFVPIVVSAGFFPSEKPSLLNEMSQSKRFDLGPYLVGRALFDVMVAVLCSTSAFILGGMTGLKGNWDRWWFSIVLQSFCSDSFGFMLATRFPAEIAIPALIPTIGFFSLLLGTNFAAPEMEGAGWIFHVCKWGSYFKYGFHSLAVDQFPLMTGNCTLGTPRCVFTDWRDAMDRMHLQHTGFVGSYRFQWMMLAFFYLAQRFVSYLALRGFVASAKFTYKAATNWEAKKTADAQRAAAAAANGGAEMVPDGANGKAHEVVVVPGASAKTNGTTSPEPHRSGSFLEHSARGNDIELRWNMHIVAEHQVGLPLFGTVEKRTLLHQQIGAALSGEVLGVLGPASSGKTVLLKALSRQFPIVGFSPDSTLEISCGVDDSALPEGAPPTTLPGVRFSYQSDNFVPGDTVTAAVVRQLGFAMKEDPTAFDKSAASILKAMGLTHVADKKASEISGGQLRRLSIACQLAHRPRIILLDEPTSGLDSELALEVMQNLSNFARASNAIVVCTLNQPGKRMLPCIDKFLFLASGRQAFLGPLDEAVRHFKLDALEVLERCPTDVILEALRLDEFLDTPAQQAASPFEPTSPTQIELTTSSRPQRTYSRGPPPAAVQRLLSQKEPVVPRCVTHSLKFTHAGKTHSATGLLPTARRLVILVRRNALSRLSNPVQYVTEQLLKFVVFLCLVGILFIRVKDPAMVNRMGIILIVNASLGFIGFVTPIVLASLERVVYERETHAEDYSPMTYQLARWIFETPAEILFCVIGVIALFYITGMEGNLGITIATTLVSYFACYGVGSTISTIPLSVSVNGGLASFTIVAFMLSADLIVTPFQINRMWFLHLLEVMNSLRQALVIAIRSEADASANGSQILVSFGLNRGLDETRVAWGLIFMNLAVYRIAAFAISWVHHLVHRRRMRVMYAQLAPSSTNQPIPT